MTEHGFTIHFVGADMDLRENFDAVFEAGCDDASFAAEGDRWHAAFDREASSYPEAVLSAIRDLESAVPTLRVTRVELDDLVTQAVIARRTGRSREGVRLLIAGRRGPGGFPEPVDYVDAGTRLWEWREVTRWFEHLSGSEPDADDAPRFTRAVNGVLAARRELEALRERAPESAPATAKALHSLLDAA